MSDTPDAQKPADQSATPSVPPAPVAPEALPAAAVAPAAAPGTSAPAMPVVPGAGAPVVVLPPENKTRGTLLALLAIPAGLIVWNIVWAIGFISGWVSLGVALVALFLYRRGSGGRLSYNGAVRLSILTVVTLAASFFIGLIIDRITFGGPVQYTGLGLNILLLVAFGVIGIVIIFRTANTSMKQQAAAEAAAGTTPSV